MEWGKGWRRHEEMIDVSLYRFGGEKNDFNDDIADADDVDQCNGGWGHEGSVRELRLEADVKISIKAAEGMKEEEDVFVGGWRQDENDDYRAPSATGIANVEYNSYKLVVSYCTDGGDVEGGIRM